MALTSAADIRHAVQDIIDADLSLEDIRRAVMALIPAEYHCRQTDGRPLGSK